MLHQCRIFFIATKECLGAPTRKRAFTYMKRPRHESQRFGGRATRVASGVKNGPKHLQQATTKERMLAVYEAQEFSRRQWKGRDFEVYEVPWSLAPPDLRRVIPELHTECPIRSAVDGKNLRHKVFDRWELSNELFGHETVERPKVPCVSPRLAFSKMLVF
ncbi:hypothetical protein XU18_1928 [Perkinsela sp. CCAP 1560/4]|nr:hypothetical protein XU18_1928 [Perkinsela sp. CCAP 1560/4]|eukprot:KNH07396.1 hypothetical protein XU18_1928 [Perkinsela sp. CCAP 1560/4]